MQPALLFSKLSSTFTISPISQSFFVTPAAIAGVVRTSIGRNTSKHPCRFGSEADVANPICDVCSAAKAGSRRRDCESTPQSRNNPVSVPLLDRQAERLDHAAPLLDLGGEHGVGLSRRAQHRVEAHVGEFFRTSGDFTMSSIAALSVARICGSVLAGAKKPTQVAAVKPGKPCSA